MILKSKYFSFKIMLSHLWIWENLRDIFWKVFPFGLTWVKKLSNKNYLMLFHVKPNGTQALDRDFWFNPRVIRMYSSKCFSKMLYSKLELVKKIMSIDQSNEIVKFVRVSQSWHWYIHEIWKTSNDLFLLEQSINEVLLHCFYGSKLLWVCVKIIVSNHISNITNIT